MLEGSTGKVLAIALTALAFVERCGGEDEHGRSLGEFALGKADPGFGRACAGTKPKEAPNFTCATGTKWTGGLCETSFHHHKPVPPQTPQPGLPRGRFSVPWLFSTAEAE